MKKISLNREVLGETLELIDAESCYVLTTQDERTVALNEVAAFILEHCDGHSEEEVITMLMESCDADSLTDEFAEEIEEFINNLAEQKLIIYV